MCITEQECNNFLAGDVIRSRAKNAKLDIRGVFGCICRHEFPALFLDMHHGERSGSIVLFSLSYLDNGYCLCRDIRSRFNFA